MSDTTATPAQTRTQTNAQAPLLAVEGLTVRFAGVTALSDVSFAVQPGELFAVIGPNGAGKTSLFNVISRVYQPAAGRVIFDGQDMARLRTHQT
ncbi:MAG TPA: ATP-binding cassette domain-containing protein, partial [Ktedonobacterales bacterium]|nr:ATP-binding cassette domain-containing protein [Ktedonobacterales bacterium]